MLLYGLLGPTLNSMFASNLRASFCFLNSAKSPELANRGGEVYAKSVVMSSESIQYKGNSSFKSANGSSGVPRCSSQGSVGAVLTVEDPPLKTVGFGCTQAAVSVCFIHHFE